jgi:hypothetical protein
MLPRAGRKRARQRNSDDPPMTGGGGWGILFSFIFYMCRIGKDMYVARFFFLEFLQNETAFRVSFATWT